MARTNVHCGIDFLMKQKLDQSNEKLRQYTLKLPEDRAGDGPEALGRLEALHSSVREMISGLQNAIGEQLGAVEIDDQAAVEVAGTVWPDEHRGLPCPPRCNDSHQEGEVWLDKAKGVIVVDKLGEGQ